MFGPTACHQTCIRTSLDLITFHCPRERQQTQMMKFGFLVLEIVILYALLVLGQDVGSLGDDLNSPDPYPSPRWRYIGEANSSNSSIPSLRVPMSHIYHRDSKYRPFNCSDKCAGRLLLEQAEAWEVSAGNFSQQKEVETLQGRIDVNYLNRRHMWAHYVTITLDQGEKAQEAELLVDTGSPTTWFQCKPCQRCYPQKRRVVNPSKSPSMRFLSQSDLYCENLQRTTIGTGANGFACKFKQPYGDSSYGSGYVVMGSFLLLSWDAQRHIMLENMAFGCGYDNAIRFNTGISGIFGLSTFHGLSWPSQVTQLMGASFGYCLPAIGSAPGEGWVALGSEKKPDPRTMPQFQSTNLLPDGESGLFYIDVIDLVVNGWRLNVNEAAFASSLVNNQKLGGFIMDSGFMITALVPQAYAYLRAAYRHEASKSFPGNIVPGLFGMDTCWDATNIDTSTTPVPTYGLLFRNGNYFQFSRTASFFTYESRAGRPLICLPISGNYATTLQANWLGGYSIMNAAMWHDMENRRLVWEPDSC